MTRMAVPIRRLVAFLGMTLLAAMLAARGWRNRCG